LKLTARYIGFTIAAILLLASCNLSKKVSKSANPEIIEADENTAERRFSYIFHNAVKEKILGNYEAAAQLYLEAIRIDPSQAMANYDLSVVYIYLGRPDVSIDFAKRAYDLDEKNIWYSLLYSSLLQQFGQIEESAKIYQKMAENNPEKVEIQFELANSYLLLNKFDDALKMYDKIESEIGINEEISVKKQKIWLKKDKLEKAVEEIEKLIKSNPSEARYYLLMADLYNGNDIKDKAEFYIDKAIEIEPSNPYPYIAKAEFLEKRGNKTESFNYLKKAFESDELEFDVKYKTLVNLFQMTYQDSTLSEPTQTLFETVEKVDNGEAKFFALFGDYLYKTGKPKLAVEKYKKSVELDKSNYNVWAQMLYIFSELNDNENLAKNAAEAVELFPSQPVVYLFAGIGYFQIKKYDESAEFLEAGAALVVDNKPLLAQFYSSLGDTYHQLKINQKSDSYYEKSLALDPLNVYVLNNYAYYLSVRNEKLEKALEMSKKSNEIQPNSSTFEDTYGWIFFQMKNYSEAKTWLEKALKNGGDKSAVILEHFGDVLFQLNDIEGAINYWKQALKLDENSERINNKIAQKKLID